jgi:hypothetical protein
MRALHPFIIPVLPAQPTVCHATPLLCRFQVHGTGGLISWQRLETRIPGGGNRAFPDHGEASASLRIPQAPPRLRGNDASRRIPALSVDDDDCFLFPLRMSRTTSSSGWSMVTPLSETRWCVCVKKCCRRPMFAANEVSEDASPDLGLFAPTRNSAMAALERSPLHTS